LSIDYDSAITNRSSNSKTFHHKFFVTILIK
jgi:hypothetical protein